MSPPMSIDGSARTLVRADANTTRADRRWRSVAGAFGIAAIVLFAQRALGEERRPPPARPSPVTLADVGSRATTTKLGNITDLLRRDVESELAAIDWTKSKVSRRYVVSASVVRLDSELRDAGLLASCTVSATLRDERGAISPCSRAVRAPKNLPARRRAPSATRSPWPCAGRSPPFPRPFGECNERAAAPAAPAARSCATRVAARSTPCRHLAWPGS